MWEPMSASRDSFVILSVVALTAPAVLFSATPLAAATERIDAKSETFGAWNMNCVEQWPNDHLPPCEVAQVVRRRGSESPALRISIAYGSILRGYGLHLTLPGDLKPGSRALIGADEGAILVSLELANCDAGKCIAEGVAAESKLEKLQESERAFVVLTTESGTVYSVPLSLNGFPQALVAMRERNIARPESTVQTQSSATAEENRLMPPATANTTEAASLKTPPTSLTANNSVSTAGSSSPAAAASNAPSASTNEKQTSKSAKRYSIQLGAYSSKAAADAEKDRIAANHASLLGGAQPIIVHDDRINSKALYRVRAGPFPSATSAELACKEFAARGQSCFVPPPE